MLFGLAFSLNMWIGRGYFSACKSGCEPPVGDTSNIHVCRAILGTFVFGILALLLPTDSPVDRKGTIDWIGAFLGTGGLIAFNIAWK